MAKITLEIPDERMETLRKLAEKSRMTAEDCAAVLLARSIREEDNMPLIAFVERERQAIAHASRALERILDDMMKSSKRFNAMNVVLRMMIVLLLALIAFAVFAR